ncbi:MAG: STAS domain-containing protein [Ignavibacteriales bacterium]|nr:STAS domain-containing protein [Ignavibacteriales bacterium]
MANPTKVSSAVGKKTATIEMTGDISDQSEEAILGAYHDITAKRAKNILLKFHPETFINSAGLRVIISLALECEQKKQSLRATGLSSHMRKVFDIIGLTEHLGIHETEEDALKGW